MPGNDEFDRKGAEAFAWRWHNPQQSPPELTLTAAEAAAGVQDTGAAEGAAPGAEKAESPGTRRSVAEMRAAARGQADELAALIDELWWRSDSVLVADIGKMLILADEAGPSLGAMRAYPLQSVRLARLGVRHWFALENRACQALQNLFLWLDQSHPDIVDLFVECARTGDLALGTAILLDLVRPRWRSLEQMPGLVERMAQVLDEGPTDEARILAVQWLWNLKSQRAVPALRRALGRPHYGLCYWALAALDDLAPEAIEAGELVALLERLIQHPPPTQKTNDCLLARAEVPGLLAAALKRKRPAAALPLILRVLRYEIPGATRRTDLDEFWAMPLLASAYPEAALPLIDPFLRDAIWFIRHGAACASAHLPDELAWPRLLIAATDGSPEVIRTVEETWRRRRAEPCPVLPTASVQLHRLAGPPSERMLARLEVLRRGSAEARAAMIEVLLGEAPDREALALLLFAAADGWLFDRRLRPALPPSRSEFVTLLFERFGLPAAEGLAEVAGRYHGGIHSWLYPLRELAREGKLPGFAHPAIRELAVRHVRERLEDPDREALGLLTALGAPDSFFDTLWTLARSPQISASMRPEAARALGRCAPGDAAWDAQIEAEMSACIDNLPRFAPIALAGIHRRQPGALALIETWLPTRGLMAPAGLDEVEALHGLVQALESADLLPEGWAEDALARPGTLLFAVAARSLRPQQAPESSLELLRAGMASDEPIGAAIAAEVMIYKGMMEQDTSGFAALIPLVARAPAPLRAKLSSSLAYAGALLPALWPLLEPLLISADPSVTRHLGLLINDLCKAGFTEQLCALLPGVHDPSLRSQIYRHLSPASYWLDHNPENEGNR